MKQHIGIFSKHFGNILRTSRKYLRNISANTKQKLQNCFCQRHSGSSGSPQRVGFSVCQLFQIVPITEKFRNISGAGNGKTVFARDIVQAYILHGGLVFRLFNFSVTTLHDTQHFFELSWFNIYIRCQTPKI